MGRSKDDSAVRILEVNQQVADVTVTTAALVLYPNSLELEYSDIFDVSRSMTFDLVGCDLSSGLDDISFLE